MTKVWAGYQHNGQAVIRWFVILEGNKTHVVYFNPITGVKYEEVSTSNEPSK